MTPAAPKRRFFLTLQWGADSRDSLAHALRHVAFEIASESSSGHVTSGAPSDGGHYDLHENPDMTHERYIEEINAWLAKENAK